MVLRLQGHINVLGYLFNRLWSYPWDSDSVVGLDQVLCMCMLKMRESREGEGGGERRKEINYNFFLEGALVFQYKSVIGSNGTPI